MHAYMHRCIHILNQSFIYLALVVRRHLSNMKCFSNNKFLPIELLDGSHEKSFPSFLVPVVSRLTVMRLLLKDLVSSVPINPVAPVISTVFPAPEKWNGVSHNRRLSIEHHT